MSRFQACRHARAPGTGADRRESRLLPFAGRELTPQDELRFGILGLLTLLGAALLLSGLVLLHAVPGASDPSTASGWMGRRGASLSLSLVAAGLLAASGVAAWILVGRSFARLGRLSELVRRTIAGDLEPAWTADELAPCRQRQECHIAGCAGEPGATDKTDVSDKTHVGHPGGRAGQDPSAVRSRGAAPAASRGIPPVPCWCIDDAALKSRVFEPRFPPQLTACRTCRVYAPEGGDGLFELERDIRLIRHVLRASWDWIRQSRSLRVSLIRNSFDAIIAVDCEDVVTIFNREAQLLFGYAEQEVIGIKTWQDILPPSLAIDLARPLDREGAEELCGFYRKELPVADRQGARIPIRASGITLADDGRTLGKVFFIQDMREIDRLRAGLIRSERLAATGQAAASISHAVKNILEGLQGGIYIYNRGKRIQDEVAAEAGWRMVEKNVGIISELVGDLLNFARDREPSLQECEPGDVARGAIDTMSGKARSRGVRVFLVDDLHDGRVGLDPFAMHQCLTNLISNAIDAIPEGQSGTVQVLLSRQGNDLLYAVKDDGVGMKLEIRQKILQGMFSTKGSKGTGLGLLAVQKIVGEHQGTLDVESQEGRGSTFTVRIPLRA